ncbi:MAG: hypothetical protein PWP23_1079 [Candidatus Sumerlaeota bacterium]|nr:hypothetical protein [Candidatus Sumerlaeota bacterium]
MARILILIGAHLCMAPRPQKEARALADAGHDVTVRGFAFDEEFARRDRAIVDAASWRYEPIADLRSGLTPIRLRARRRIAGTLYRAAHCASVDLFGYGAREMLAAARKENADLTIVHSEAGLWVGTRLLAEGRRVGVDFEDWFSEDLLPRDRRDRPVGLLREWEQQLACACRYALAPSLAMSNAIAASFDAPPPAVVRNVFPREGEPDFEPERRADHGVSLHWYSQTIGPGRGLEMLMQALHRVAAPVRVVLRGRCSESYRNALLAEAPEQARGRILVEGSVPPDQLAASIARHDIGLALEDSSVRSRDLTITNKLFEYLRGGLAVIATPTTGQREVFAERPGIGVLLESSTPDALAAAIDSLVADAARLAACRSAARLAFEEQFNWERERGILVERAEAALAS